MIDRIKKFCSGRGIACIENAMLLDYLTFRVGGPCKAMLFPDSIEKISDLLRFFRENGCKYYIIGKGSNLIAPDEGYEGFIINTSNLEGIELESETLTCLAGTPLIKVCRFALDNSLTGLECEYGIPGSVGGAVYMNAGAYGGEIKDIIISSTHIVDSENLITLPAESLCLSYRSSFYSEKDYTIVSAVFKLARGEKSLIKDKMDTLMAKRRDKQPLEFPSAGSTFKRPEGYFAGALIEENGLKGYTVGGAQVSEKHAGFVINRGGATCDDILRVIDHCRETVFKATGITLETEVKMIN